MSEESGPSGVIKIVDSMYIRGVEKVRAQG